MFPRHRLVLLGLVAATSVAAQGNPSRGLVWTPDSTKALARLCDDIRFPIDGVDDTVRKRRADDVIRRARLAADPRASAACLVARSDVYAMLGDIPFMVDSIAGYLHTLDSLGERRLSTDLRLMRGGSLIAPGLLQLAREDLTRSMLDARALPDSVLEFWSAMNLAQALYASGNPTAAFQPARRAIALAQGLSEVERGVGVALEADILASRGRWKEADVLYDSAARRAQRIGYAAGSAHAMELQGSMAMRQRDWPRADSVLQEAVRAVVRGGYGGNVGQLNYMLASVSLQRGRLPEARARLTAARRNAVDDGNLVRFIRAREAEILWREGDLAGAAKTLRDAADAMDRYRATLTHRDARLAAFEASPDDTDPDAGIASIIAAFIEHGMVEDAFDLTERGRARELLARLPAAVAAGRAGMTTRWVQQALPDSTALLEYVVGRGGEPTAILVVTRDTVRGFVTTPVDSLEPAIARLRATLEGNGNARVVAAALGEALLQPVVGTLSTGVTTLVIVPDGALHRVPFDVLRLADGRFVFERFATSVAPSAAVAAALLSAPRPVTEGIVAIGGATYARADSVPALPHAEREVSMVARLGAPVTVLRGGDASPTRVASAMRGPHRLVHIATHARADEYGTGDGALVLSADSTGAALLSAAQLLELGVSADLVVLSACRSGVGPLLRGEGMQALTAPFLAGGTRSVLATMWLVGDRSTVPLMTEFYAQLAAGHPVAEALRRARLKAWQDGALPREWAAFVAVGDPTIRLTLRAPQRLHQWWIASGTLVLLGAIGMWLYRSQRRSRGD